MRNRASEAELNELARFLLLSFGASPRDPEFFSTRDDAFPTTAVLSLFASFQGAAKTFDRTTVESALASTEKDPGSLGCARDDTRKKGMMQKNNSIEWVRPTLSRDLLVS